MMVKVAVLGATGRMGQQLTAVLAEHDTAQLVAALTHSQSSQLGQVVPGHAQLTYSDDISKSAADADVMVDFSLPQALPANLAAAQAQGTPLVVCTTGLTDAQQQQLQAAAQQHALLYAANTSLGVNVLLNLVRTASKALGQGCDIEILEAHHTAKRDAPSGTALALGEAAADGRGQSLQSVANFNRNQDAQGYVPGSIGFATLRAGDIVGEHTVYLVCGGERLELTHRVASRRTFAEGALNAALWLASQKAGFYTMNHVLGLDA